MSSNTEIVAGNKLIMDFMNHTEFTTLENKLQYHSSWDWLMPVVEKINKVWWSDFKNGWDEIDEEELKTQKEKVTTLHLTCSIKHARKCIISFITWYNKSKEEGVK